MSKQLLRIVGPEDSNGLQVINNGEESYIANGDIIVSEKTSSPNRPLHCSEVAKKMEGRFWHKFDTKFIGNDNKIYLRYYEHLEPTGIIDLINTDTTDQNFRDWAIPYYEVQVSDSIQQDTEELYEKLFGAMKEREVSFFSLPNKVINITDGSVIFDLINFGSSEYTDTVSLSEILKSSVAPIESGSIDLGIQYTKNNHIYSGETTFLAFSFKNGTLSINNLVEDFNGDARIEFIEGTIKVSPLTNDINECIINKCTLTYGRN